MPLTVTKLHLGLLLAVDSLHQRPVWHIDAVEVRRSPSHCYRPKADVREYPETTLSEHSHSPLRRFLRPVSANAHAQAFALTPNLVVVLRLAVFRLLAFDSFRPFHSIPQCVVLAHQASGLQDDKDNDRISHEAGALLTGAEDVDVLPRHECIEFDRVARQSFAG